MMWTSVPQTEQVSTWQITSSRFSMRGVSTSLTTSFPTPSKTAARIRAGIFAIVLLSLVRR